MNINQGIINSLVKEKILILGLGREGQSTYKFLRQVLPSNTLAVADENPELPDLFSSDNNLITHLGLNYLENLNSYTLIFKTPGIPLSIPQIKSAVDSGIKISSNLQLLLEIIETEKQKSKTKILNLPTPLTIGVTGTKGKSTTASLINHTLGSNKINSVLVGNIGKPALEEINHIKTNGVFVIEMSSHQLSHLTISPDIAVVQEITSEHLDYYKSTDKYVHSKEAITKYQKVNQYILFNPKKRNTTKIANLSPGIKQKFVIGEAQNDGNIDTEVYLKSHYLTFRHNKIEEQIIHQDNIPLLGTHNLQNIAPSIIVGKLLGLSVPQVSNAIGSFTPLPHRLEKVGVVNGVIYVNDSMATMPDATISALSCFDNKEIILLAGGHERNQDFQALAEKIIRSNVVAVGLFPENGKRLGEKIQNELLNQRLNKKIETKIVNSMEEAMNFTKEYGKKNSVVLLSPGAASFGVFIDYADRGNQFKKWVEKINSPIGTESQSS